MAKVAATFPHKGDQHLLASVSQVYRGDAIALVTQSRHSKAGLLARASGHQPLRRQGRCCHPSDDPPVSFSVSRWPLVEFPLAKHRSGRSETRIRGALQADEMLLRSRGLRSLYAHSKCHIQRRRYFVEPDTDDGGILWMSKNVECAISHLVESERSHPPVMNAVALTAARSLTWCCDATSPSDLRDMRSRLLVVVVGRRPPSNVEPACGPRVTAVHGQSQLSVHRPRSPRRGPKVPFPSA